MAKKKDTEVVVMTPELTAAIAKFEAVKAQIDVMGHNLLAIKVKDESTLAIAQQNLSKANDLVKLVEDKRKSIKEKPWKECVTIDEAAKIISKTITEGIASVKKEVVNWETERQAKEKAAKEKLTAALSAVKTVSVDQAKLDILQYIIHKAAVSLKAFSEKSTTPDACDEHIKIIEDKYKPRDFFGEYAQNAYDLKDAYITLITVKRRALNGDAKSSFHVVNAQIVVDNIMLYLQKLERDLAKQVADQTANKSEAEKITAELENLEAESALNKTKNIRANWKFELVDKTKLTPEWTTIDEAAVKEYLAENKGEIKDGEVINGVKFYKDIIAIA